MANYRLVFPLLLGLLLASGRVSAQNPAGGTAVRPAEFVHTPPQPNELPLPGQPVTLSAQILHTRDTKRPVRVAVVKDGQFVDMDTKPAYLDKNDRPTYELSVLAPLGELSYQFLLFNPDGTVTSSQRYAVRRQCLPNIQIVEGEVPASVQGDERLREVIAESKALERELLGYKQVLKTLDELQAAVAK